MNNERIGVFSNFCFEISTEMIKLKFGVIIEMRENFG